jgi:hypothetical protein
VRLKPISGHKSKKEAIVPIRFGVILGCLLLAACTAATPPPDTARLPMGTFGLADNDMGAINLASSAFASAGRTRNNPVGAARAAAAVDYLAGQLSSSPRWLSVSPLIKQQMLQARTDVRQVLGITPDASSQAVVNALLQFADAWQAGNQSAAMQALGAPVFTLPPMQTQQVLSNMPPMPSVNTATMNAASAMRGSRL